MAEDQSSTPTAAVEYRDVDGFPGYRVGDDGSVWTQWKRVGVSGRGRGACIVQLGTEWKLLKQTRSGDRLTVTLYAGERRETFFVHRLVAQVFFGPRPGRMHVCHNDGNARNNALSNLRYDTPKANAADKIRHGTHRRGTQLHNAKLNEDDVRVIRKRLSQGDTLAAIAKDYGVDFTLISIIKRRKAWSWVQ